LLGDPPLRNALVAALLACSDNTLKRKAKARRFLEGLSSDELQFIAEYLGARILESTETGRASADRSMAEFQNLPYRPGVSDRDHKMILLVEYLRRSGLPLAVRA
jgi:hypothetical protein